MKNGNSKGVAKAYNVFRLAGLCALFAGLISANCIGLKLKYILQGKAQ